MPSLRVGHCYPSSYRSDTVGVSPRTAVRLPPPFPGDTWGCPSPVPWPRRSTGIHTVQGKIAPSSRSRTLSPPWPPYGSPSTREGNRGPTGVCLYPMPLQRHPSRVLGIPWPRRSTCIATCIPMSPAGDTCIYTSRYAMALPVHCIVRDPGISRCPLPTGSTSPGPESSTPMALY
jgi:hypothetical protein